MWAKKKKTMGVSRAFRTLGLLSMIVRELAPSSTSTWREENAMSHTFRDTDKFQNINKSKSCTVCIMQQDDCIQQRWANLPCCRHRCNRWVKTCLLLPLVTRSSQDNVFWSFFLWNIIFIYNPWEMSWTGGVWRIFRRHVYIYLLRTTFDVGCEGVYSLLTNLNFSLIFQVGDTTFLLKTETGEVDYMQSSAALQSSKQIFDPKAAC